MTGSAMNLKVFLRNGDNVDVRRFSVDQEVVTSFLFIKEKLQNVFPVLRNAQYNITWEDSEGDNVTIASDDDLIIAFTEIPGDVKVLTVTVSKQSDDVGLEALLQGRFSHRPRVICDVCEQTITGYRYKCIQCPDYDLCAVCEHEGHHSEHLMMRVPHGELDMPKCARKFVHHFARSLRKSAYAASRDACRFAKHCAKANAASEACAGQMGEAAPKKQDQPHNSDKATSSGSCPFSSDAKINLNDVHALGALARQHLGPILEVASNVVQQGGNLAQNLAQPNQPAADEGGAILADLIRNAVDGFFGLSAEHQKQNTEEKPTSGTSTPSSSHTPANDASTSTAGPSTQAAYVPMDVEQPSQGKYPNLSDFTADRREPGWTFVSPEASAEKPAAKELDPKVAAFAQHPNPKISEGLVQLYEMGFNNENGFLTRLLEKYDGNVAQVVKAIVERKY